MSARRSIVAIAVLAIAGASVYAGGAQDQAAETEVVQVEFWNLFGGGDGETIVEIVDYYNEMNPGVEIINMTQDWGQFYTRLRTAVLGGVSPDLAMSHVTRLLELKTVNLIEPLDEHAFAAGVQIDWSVYPSGMLDAVTFDGELYSVPMDNLLFVLLANKKILTEHGMVGQDGSVILKEGFDEFVEQLAIISDGGDVPLASSMSGWPPATLWFTLYKQLGGVGFISDDLRRADWDHRTAVEAMTALQTLYDRFVPAELDSPGEFFRAGNAAFEVTGPWAINQAVSVFGDDLEVLRFPRLFQESVFWTDSHGFVLPTNPDRSDRQTQEALRFVRWFADENWRWAKAGHIPASTAARQSPEFRAMTHRENIIAPIDVVSFPATPNVWLTFAPELYEPIERMFGGVIGPEQTVNEIQQRLNASLARGDR